MNRVYILLSFFSLVVTIEAHARDLHRIRQTGELRSCFVPWMGTGKDRGPDADLTDVFARHLGVKNKAVEVEWKQQFEKEPGVTELEGSYIPFLLANGQCDLFASNMTILPWRQKKMDFVKVFHNQSMLLSSKKLAPKIKGVADLAGLRAVAIPMTTYMDEFKKFNATALQKNPIKIISVENEDTTEKVKNGDADLVILDTYLALREISKRESMLEIVFPVGEREEIGWAFSPRDKTLSKAFKKFLDESRPNQSSDLNQVYLKYFNFSLIQMDEMNFFIKERDKTK